MKKLLTLALALGVIPTLLQAQDPTNFATSLHGTRGGKATWYGAENGGFEALTNIPMSELPCQHCHALTYATGDTVDPATYEPDCKDCHDFANQGTTVEQQTCLGCHSRQRAEIALSQKNLLYSDVHRDRGMVCKDCHTKREMHGDGSKYSSLRESGAMDASCENQACHPPDSLAGVPAHDRHLETVYCTACHVQTVSTCYSCHFETEVQAHQKRFFGPPPIGGFVFLVRREPDGKVATASYQALTYNGKTFYAVGVFNGHTISKEGRACTDCHNTELVQAYKSTGTIDVAKWDAAESKVRHTQGVIPIPPDWQTALQFDFVTYTGDVADPTKPLDPSKWTVLKSTPDGSQMLFAEPLTAEQMDKLAMNVVSVNAPEEALPQDFALAQNYPNPFNPQTTITFRIPKSTVVSLKIYDLLGTEVRSVLKHAKLGPGTYKYLVNLEDLSSGIYLYRLETPEYTACRKMTLLK